MVGFEYSSSWLHWIVIVSYTVILLYYIFWNFTLCLVLLWGLPCQIKSYSHHIHCCGRYVPNVACAWDVLLRCGDFSRTGPKVHGHWEMPKISSARNNGFEHVERELLWQGEWSIVMFQVLLCQNLFKFEGKSGGFPVICPVSPARDIWLLASDLTKCHLEHVVIHFDRCDDWKFCQSYSLFHQSHAAQKGAWKKMSLFFWPTFSWELQ